MKIISETSIYNFESWSGAKDTQKAIIENNKETEFENLIDELYPDGLTDTELNDLLWFESDWIFELLGIENDEDNN